jgi:hypothetical protein
MTTAVNDTSKIQRPQQRVQAGQQVGERWYSEKRLGGLSRFAFAITVLNILGHLFLGFEQSWITPFVALAAAYGTDLVGETVEARVNRRPARYAGSFLNLVKFLLPAHISGLAIGMLLYAAENVAAVAFAVSVAMASKYVFRVAVGTDRDGRLTARHFLNPSNFGITVTLVLFPTVGIAPPYQFSENISGALDWLLPLLVIGTGSLLNLKATGRIPLILAWVAAFAAQAILRAFIDGTPVLAGLMPMTGFAFVLFTFYMITDPATTPARRDGQIAFAVAVAAAYALFMELNIVFGLFYALTSVTAGRGLWLFVTRPRPAPAPAMQMSPAE